MGYHSLRPLEKPLDPSRDIAQAYAGEESLVDLLLEFADATQQLQSVGCGLSALMWAHWHLGAVSPKGKGPRKGVKNQQEIKVMVI